VLLLALALTLNLAHLGARSLMLDEALYANVAWEAAVNGHWYPLVHRGTLYVAKPPLAVSLQAALFRLVGVSEVAARLPSALSGVSLVMLLYGFVSWLTGRWAGLLAGALLASCRPWLFEHGTRDGVTDALLCLLLTAALLLYLRFRSTGDRRWLLAAGLATAVSSLVKGLLGPFLLLVITACWEILMAVLPAPGQDAAGGEPAPGSEPAAGGGPARPSLGQRLLAPLALALGGTGPYLVWWLDISRRRSGMLATTYRDIVVRATRGLDPRHVHGAGFYPHVLGQAFGHWWPALVPAALALLVAWRRGGPRAGAFLLLPTWAGVVLGVLYLSVSRLAWYVDPILPPIAALIAAGCAETAHRLGRWPVLRLLFALALATLAGLRCATAWQILAMPYPQLRVQRLAATVPRLPGARLYMERFHLAPEQLREWNVFYFGQLERAALPIPATLPAHACSVVVTTDPAALAARPGFAGAVVIRLDKLAQDEADLFVLDLCGGEVARRLGAS
jgi:4-amino-4-deoxy-L-arabinose transferase-like glycosyltransferase